MKRYIRATTIDDNTNDNIENMLKSRLLRFNNISDIKVVDVVAYGGVLLQGDYDETQMSSTAVSGSMFGNVYFKYGRTKYGVQVRCNFYRRSEDRSDIDFQWIFRPMIWVPKEKEWYTFRPANEFMFQPDDIRNIMGNDFENVLYEMLRNVNLIVNPNLRPNIKIINYQDAILE